jgi:hypothetical protein
LTRFSRWISLGAIWWSVAAASLLSLAPVTSEALAAHITPAGTALARATLLSRADVGRGWSSAPPPRHTPPLTCPQFSPIVGGVRQIGAATSPTFRASARGPFVAQDAYAYATASQQTVVWRAVVRPALGRCAANSLASGGGQGVTLAVTATQPLRLPALPVRAAGYRVTATASTNGQSLTVFLDMIVLGAGRAITTIGLSSLEQPTGKRLELRLVRTVALRLLHEEATLRRT